MRNLKLKFKENGNFVIKLIENSKKKVWIEVWTQILVQSEHTFDKSLAFFVFHNLSSESSI